MLDSKQRSTGGAAFVGSEAYELRRAGSVPAPLSKPRRARRHRTAPGGGDAGAGGGRARAAPAKPHARARESGGRGVTARPLARWPDCAFGASARAAVSEGSRRARLDSKRDSRSGLARAQPPHGAGPARRERGRRRRARAAPAKPPARARESGGRGVTGRPLARGPGCVFGA